MSGVDCGWSEGCAPRAKWGRESTSRSDTSRIDKSAGRVSPALEDMRVDTSPYDSIRIEGRSKGRTRYKLSLGTVFDKFGQPLEAPRETTVDVSAAEPILFEEERPMVVLDPGFAPTLSVYSVNRNALRVRLYSVEPRDFPAYLRYRDAFAENGRIT